MEDVKTSLSVIALFMMFFALYSYSRGCRVFQVPAGQKRPKAIHDFEIGLLKAAFDGQEEKFSRQQPEFVIWLYRALKVMTIGLILAAILALIIIVESWRKC